VSIIHVNNRSLVSQESLCFDHANAKIPREDLGGRAGNTGDAVFDVSSIMYFDDYDGITIHNRIYLQDVSSASLFCIECGPCEAGAIQWRLSDEPPRPPTHTVLHSAILALGGIIEDVVIRDLIGRTYYADIRIRQGIRNVTLDVRPSDAIAVAIVSHVPIRVSERLLIAMAAKLTMGFTDSAGPFPPSTDPSPN